jgi:hypothetical protein
MRILQAIDRLDDVIHAAPPVPLTASVRLDEALLRAAVGVIRTEANQLFGSPSAHGGPIGEMFGALDELDELVATAKAIPLTDQVRVSKERAYEHLDRVRRSLPSALKAAQRSDTGSPPPWSAVLDEVDRLEGRMHEFERPVVPWVKVDAQVLRDGLARVRVSATQNLGPPSGPDGPVAALFMALDELDALAGDAGPTDRVRVRRLPLFVLIDRVRTAVVEAGLSEDDAWRDRRPPLDARPAGETGSDRMSQDSPPARP